MDCLPDSDWDLDYYSRLIDEAAPTDFFLNDSPSAGLEIESSFTEATTQANEFRKRERDEPCVSQGSKACREKMRRDRMNKRHAFGG
uniref:Transcription factor bHLH115 isoform X4 n=1 Tax=Elaeis guineensis var. tenera TaxID=51953 RepID=A0A6I9R7A6_ELAGV|nr:transcription factor bHLH115 isoform X4 [Elaeis guineensis]